MDGNGNLLLGKWYGWAWKLDEIGIYIALKEP
jgi:hypothetical protein